MTLIRPALCIPALILALPVHAGTGLRFGVNHHDSTTRVDVLDAKTKSTVKYGQCWVFAGLSSSLGTSGSASTATATVKSDAGSEGVVLVESDAWLHGGAVLKALPKTNAVLELTVYDKANASLISFSGTLGTDGSVALAANATKDAGTTCDASSKSGCSETDTSSAAAPDIEVMAGEVFAGGSGYELSLDLAGADTGAVAYAEITVTESDKVTTCSKETGVCTTTGTSTTTKAEVDWDDIGAVWEGDITLDHDGIIDVKVTSYDTKGAELESTKAALGAPWLDGGYGINVLATDDDPLTSVGFMRWDGSYTDGKNPAYWTGSRPILVVNSGGWTLGETLPIHAQVGMTNGGTVTMTSFILMRMRKRPELLYQAWDDTLREYITEIVDNPIYDDGGAEHNPLLDARLNITGGNFEILGASVFDMMTPVCTNGTCVKLITDGEGRFDVSVSTYGTDALALADDDEIVVALVDQSGKELASEAVFVEYDDEITVTFANEVTFSADPMGLDLAGSVSLLGVADKKGKQKTLAKGKFYGTFSRDTDGDLGITGAAKESLSSRGDIVAVGGPVDVELKVDTNQNGVFEPPPLTPVFGNGSGTKNATSQTSAKPELL